MLLCNVGVLDSAVYRSPAAVACSGWLGPSVTVRVKVRARVREWCFYFIFIFKVRHLGVYVRRKGRHPGIFREI